MALSIESRPSDSPWISTVWTSRSQDVATMTAVASETWGLVFWQHEGGARATVIGPESRTAVAPVPAEAHFVGIQFTVGTSLRMAETSTLVDRGIPLPDVDDRSFWLDGRRWRTPEADDAESLVDRFVQHGIIVRDPVVASVLRGERPELSPRTVERRFRAAAGLTHGAVRQIERARTAANRLAAGTAVEEVVHHLGFYDEPHLARNLRRYVGRTAHQLRAGSGGAIALDTVQRTTA